MGTTTISTTTSTATTSAVKNTGHCFRWHVEYSGQRMSTLKTDSPHKCMKRCKMTKLCQNWTWYSQKKYIPKLKRLRCILRKNIWKVGKKTGAVSGVPNLCSKKRRRRPKKKQSKKKFNLI